MNKPPSPCESPRSSLFSDAPTSPSSAATFEENSCNTTPPLPHHKLPLKSLYRKVSLKRSKTQTKPENENTVLAQPPSRSKSAISAQSSSSVSRQTRVTLDLPKRARAPQSCGLNLRISYTANSRVSSGFSNRVLIPLDSVLKLKIFFAELNDEIVAVKLRKDKLASIDELVDVVLLRLKLKCECDPNSIKVSMMFPDRLLTPVVLRDCHGGPSFTQAYGDFLMEYIQHKSKVYIRATVV